MSPRYLVRYLEKKIKRYLIRYLERRYLFAKVPLRRLCSTQ